MALAISFCFAGFCSFRNAARRSSSCWSQGQPARPPSQGLARYRFVSGFWPSSTLATVTKSDQPFCSTGSRRLRRWVMVAQSIVGVSTFMPALRIWAAMVSVAAWLIGLSAASMNTTRWLV